MPKEFRSNDFTLWEKSPNKKLDSIFQVSSELKFSLEKRSSSAAVQRCFASVARTKTGVIPQQHHSDDWLPGM
jgi:hypothetical protein